MFLMFLMLIQRTCRTWVDLLADILLRTSHSYADASEGRTATAWTDRALLRLRGRSGIWWRCRNNWNGFQGGQIKKCMVGTLWRWQMLSSKCEVTLPWRAAAGHGREGTVWWRWREGRKSHVATPGSAETQNISAVTIPDQQIWHRYRLDLSCPYQALSATVDKKTFCWNGGNILKHSA